MFLLDLLLHWYVIIYHFLSSIDLAYVANANNETPIWIYALMQYYIIDTSITFPTSWLPKIFVIADLIDVVVISANDTITAARQRISGFLASNIQIKEPSAMLRHIAVIFKSCNFTAWIIMGNIAPNKTQLNTI